jgi:hypothetical protein
MPLNIFDGSSWNPFKKIQIHNGTNWNESKASYMFNGTEWKLFSTGAPTNLTLPSYSQSNTGTAMGSVEQTLVATNGTWDNSPTSYRYVWETAPYSNSSYNWQALTYNGVAQTNQSAYLSSNWVGYLVRVKVYASNGIGESTLPAIFESGLIWGPQAIQSFTAYTVSDGRIYMLWEKSKGANGYYVQYQGSEVTFTELILPAINEEPGTSVEPSFGNKYLELGSTKRGTLFISIWPTSNSNPFSNILASRLQGGGKQVSLSTIRTSTPPIINSSSLTASSVSGYPALISLTMNLSVNSYGSPAGTVNYSWPQASFYNGSANALFDQNGTTVSCTATITNSEGSVSTTAYYTLPVYVAPPSFDGFFVFSDPNNPAMTLSVEGSANTNSWAVYRSGGGLISSGNGRYSPGIYDSGLAYSTTYTYTAYVYSGANQTGVSASASTSRTTINPAPVTTYGSCTSYDTSTSYSSECSGTYSRNVITTTTFYQRQILINGNWNGSYDYNCGTTSSYSYSSYSQIDGVCGYTTPAPPACVCNYSTTETQSYHYAPEWCPGGSQRAGSLSGRTVNDGCPNVSKTPSGYYQCSTYDVNISSSTNYYQCYSPGACTAPRNPDGSRAKCYS